jgi:hypothetical protein
VTFAEADDDTPAQPSGAHSTLFPQEAANGSRHCRPCCGGHVRYATAQVTGRILHSPIGKLNDIAEGVLLVRSAAGVREHGSVLGRELLRIGGEIVDAPTISLDEALGLVDADYAMVLARLAGSRS